MMRNVGYRYGLLVLLLSAGLYADAVNPRIARIGLMTDTHVKETMESCARVKAALELFKEKGVEMVIHCGDLADRHFPEGYRCYRRTVNAVYPDPKARPREVYVYAGHDVNNFRPNSGWNMSHAPAAYEEMRQLLEAPNGHTCDFVWKGLPFAVFPQNTGGKGFLTWEDYEKTVARLCAENPGKPVFVCDHVPPSGTTFHSRHWGSVNCRRILNKFPQVVSISGHVHGSLVSERQVWQGEFTAINLGCLEAWGGFAPGSTPPPQAKPSFGVLVMDVYADRLVVFRHDVRDGSEYGAPWVVPLPFVAREAPYRPETHAKRLARAAFAPGASVAVKPDGDAYVVEFPEARTGADAFMYRLGAQRKGRDGVWETFTRDDVFGDFWKAEKDRTGRMAYRLDAGFFTPGETYRMTVTPLDYFYRSTAAIDCTFTAGHVMPVRVWRSDDPMADCTFTEYGRSVPKTPDGRFAPPSGQGTLYLPEHVFKTLRPGTRHRLVLDLDLVQPDEDWCAWRLSLVSRSGTRLASAQTSPGRSGTLRYVMAFTVPKDGLDTCNILFNYASPGGSLRVVGAEIF